MIITKTPFRVSFFGGGTDYHTWYREHGGQVISTTIDKYCYIQVRQIQKFFNYKYRLCWKLIEECLEVESISHPVMREVFKIYNIENISLHHETDIPGRSGIGSSSSFTVGMLKMVSEIKGLEMSKEEIAKKAIYIEREILKESVGVQDQIAASYGGFNRITINKNDTFKVEKMDLNNDTLLALNSYMMLIFTGLQRNANDIAAKQIAAIKDRYHELSTISQITDEAYKILKSGTISFDDFGKLLHESWLLKRSLTNEISNDNIDELYNKAMKNGATGGKLLGAGAGGFLLFFAKPEYHNQIAKALGLLQIPFKFEEGGTRVIYTNGQ